MKRLTMKNQYYGNKDLKDSLPNVCKYACDMGDGRIDYGTIIEKLGAYEDLGFEPAELVGKISSLKNELLEADSCLALAAEADAGFSQVVLEKDNQIMILSKALELMIDYFNCTDVFIGCSGCDFSESSRKECDKKRVEYFKQRAEQEVRVEDLKC